MHHNNNRPWIKFFCVLSPSLLHVPVQDSLRWIVAQKNRVRNGELYRFVADTRGAFAQPALYEAFGLTVIEAMTCGLPTFATCNGGPSEIIKHGRSGYHINPYHGSAVSGRQMWKWMDTILLKVFGPEGPQICMARHSN